MSGLLTETLKVAPPTVNSAIFATGAKWAPQKVTCPGGGATTHTAVAMTQAGGGYFEIHCEGPLAAEEVVDENNVGVFIVFGATDMAAATGANGTRLAAGERITFYFESEVPGTTSAWCFSAIAAGSEDSIVSIRKTGD